MKPGGAPGFGWGDGGGVGNTNPDGSEVGGEVKHVSLVVTTLEPTSRIGEGFQDWLKSDTKLLAVKGLGTDELESEEGSKQKE